MLPPVQNGKIQNGRVGDKFGGQSGQLTSSNSELLKYGDKVGGCAGGREAGGRAESSPGALNPHCAEESASHPDGAGTLL